MSSEVEVPPKPVSVKFQQFHQPMLTAGDYTISIEQAVEIKDKDKIVTLETFKAKRNFTVAGERFELNPTDIEAVFPPDGNLGEHSNVLPHIILSRSTLPWERTAERYAEGEQKKVTNVPWLALLLFDEDQKPTPRTLKANDLVAEQPPGSPKFPRISLESWQHPDDAVTVIDVPRSVLRPIMPTVDELKMLAHVRFGAGADGKLIGDELAVIIANRLPQAGKTSTAHLVSLEGRFEKGTVEGAPEEYGFNYKTARDADLIRLVSLKSWSFACSDPKKSFKHLLLGLNTTPSTLRVPGGVRAAEDMLARGYVVVPHHFRQGDQTASWFHGPLTPGKNMSPRVDLPLPARSADELVRYDPELSMFDVSYAAAWEVGRLLALQDKAFSTSLYQWKREYAQKMAQEEQRSDYLPYQKATLAFVPETVSAWFKSLRNLEGVPFNYLVPDERMLPAESIRFFRVDRVWLDCLADGAFSIGRVASSDLEDDKSHGMKSPAAGIAPMLTGFLLRSEVVSGWPGLFVDGYSDGKGEHRLDVQRVERLAAGVLLCVFAGEVARVDIHQKPETLHFGLRVNGRFYKDLRKSDGGELGKAVELVDAHWRSVSLRTLNIGEFADSMRQQLSHESSLTSADFALQMVEGVENVIFLGKP